MARSESFLVFSKIKNLYEKTISLVFATILLFITMTMIIGVVRLFYQLGTLIQAGGITGNYLNIFTDVLTLFILIELSRALFEYFTSHRIRLTPIIDAAIVFVLRHIMIDLFNHKLDTDSIYAFSALLLVLGIIRFSTSITYRRERTPPHISEREESTTP